MLLSQPAETGGFAAPVVFEPLGRLVAGAHAREFDFKSGKPEYPLFNFVGVVAKEEPQQERVRAGEHKHARGFAFEPLVPAERLLAVFVFAHIEGEPGQPHPIEHPL